MPIHDWKRVVDGVYLAFHHLWISAISDVLNAGLLPKEYYALPEQVAAGFGQDVLTLEVTPRHRSSKRDGARGGLATAKTLQTRPRTTIVSQSSPFPRKKSAIAVRHASGDRLVAFLEIVSPGNKSADTRIRTFVRKARQMLADGVHLLVVDPFAPGPRDPDGLHGLIWNELGGEEFHLTPDKPLTLAAYEAGRPVRAYVEPVAVGDPLPAMPLFLERNGCVMAPLESTYSAAFAAMPARWRDVLQPPAC